MLKKIFPFLIPIVLFLLIAFAYNSPILSGKVLVMHDTQMAGAGAKEINDYHEKTGEWSAWTNSMFGGMPAFMIAGDYPNSIGTKLGRLFYQILPLPVNIIFLLMLGFYVLAVVLRFDKWIGTIGAIGFAFGTYNLLYTEAGHVSKILAIAYVPVVLAGFVLVFRKRYALGTLLTALGLTLEIYANHLQITYYLFFIVLVYALYHGVKLLIAKEFKTLGIIVGCLAMASFVAIGSHAQRLWSNMVYSAESTRGKSELTNATAGKDGLDRDYAFGWSYGIDETGNLLIPNLMGGGTTGSLSTSSETFQTLVQGGVPAENAAQIIQNLPLYHGEQTYTSGPAYTGIVLVFLFVLGLFINRGKWKWFLLGFVVFFIALAWGKNFAVFNNLVFDLLPGYNKFRAVTMTLIVSHFLIALGAGFTLNRIKDKVEDLAKPILYTAGGLIGLMLLFYFGIDYSGLRDSQLQQSFGQSIGNEFASRVVNAMIVDREAMAFSDVLRSSFLIFLVAGVIWFWNKGKLNNLIAFIAIGLFVTFDLFSVGKRYFNNDDFSTKLNAKAEFNPSVANQQILQDTDPNFRIINLATSFTQDATDSYFHKSLGGYHGAKLKRTQELFDQQLIKDGRLNQPVINMLNTKYFIVQGQDGQLQAQLNTEALGNAWFVKELKVVANADEELAALGEGFDPKNNAYVQKKYIGSNQSFSQDSTAKITMTSYAPNALTYESNASSKQFAVFSEIYYRGNVDWLSFIDDQPAEHVKVEYVLRGMEIPAGKHTIRFEFKPKTVEKGKLIDLVASIGLVVIFAGSIYFELKKDKK